MASHIHVKEEEVPRLVGFDTAEIALYAAGLMGLDPGSYTLGGRRPLRVSMAGVTTARMESSAELEVGDPPQSAQPFEPRFVLAVIRGPFNSLLRV